MFNLMIKNLNYEACVDSKYDLILALNCFKEVSSFKLEGREFQSLAPAEAKLFLKKFVLAFGTIKFIPEELYYSL